jgi:cell division protein FtsI (penicillin-binding protein 3)
MLILGTGQNKGTAGQRPDPIVPRPEPAASSQSRTVAAVLAVLFVALGAQLTRLALRPEPSLGAAAVEPVPSSFARPDIVDRNGRLLATDVEVQSLYADPARLIDRDEILEKLRPLLPDLDEGELSKALLDRTRRFVWIRRGLTPKLAQAIHNLGLPGLAFRRELRRVYPLGALAGHIIGHVGIDNRGTAGVERHIDEAVGIDAVHATAPSERPAVRLSLEIGVQAGLEAELADATARYGAQGAAAVIMDANSGEIVASASLPRREPARPADALDPAKRDRLQAGTYELGSIFKAVTIAMAIERAQVSIDTMVDVRTPLTAGRFTIQDLHPAGRPLSVSEIFTTSSNVGAGMLALEAGAVAQRAFFDRLGLLSAGKTEAGPIAAPQIPGHWDRVETITLSYGHGLAVAPLQFAASASALVNGGLAVTPTYLQRMPGSVPADAKRVIAPETSAAIRTLMRRNVTDEAGTGRRADVVGYGVGGKTGTADIPGPRGYRRGGVISSFIAAFPMEKPRYVVLLMLFEPKGNAATGGKVLAGLTAAPATGRLIARIGPRLGL